MTVFRFNMPKRWGAAFLAALVSVAALSAQDEALAVIGPDTVGIEQFVVGYPRYLSANNLTDSLATRLDYLHLLMGRKLMISQARDEGRHRSPEIRLASYHAWRNVLIDQVGGRYFLAQTSRTEEVVNERYRFEQTRIKTRIIVTPDSVSAEIVLAALRSGTPFEALALPYHQPVHPLDKPWEHGWRYSTLFDRQIAAAAFTMDDGDIAGPVKVASGYAIIHLVGKRFSPSHGHFGRVQRRAELTEQIGMEINFEKVLGELRRSVSTHRIRWNKRRLRKVIKGHYLIQDDPLVAVAATDPNLLTQPLFTVDKQPRLIDWVVTHLSLLPPDANLLPLDVVEMQDILSEMMMMDQLLKLIEELPDGNYWLGKAEQARREAVDEMLAVEMADQLMTEAKPDEGILLDLWGNDSSKYFIGAQVDLQEIIVENLATAVLVDSLLRGGSSFSALARKFTDREWARPASGRLNFVPQNMYAAWSPTLEHELSDAIAGTLIGPVELDGYYLFLKIWDRRPESWLYTDALLRHLHLRWLLEAERAVLDGWTKREQSKHYPIEINSVVLESLSWPDEDIPPLSYDAFDGAFDPEQMFLP